MYVLDVCSFTNSHVLLVESHKIIPIYLDLADIEAILI